MIERSHRAARDFLKTRGLRVRPMRRGEEEALSRSGARAFRMGEPERWLRFLTLEPRLISGGDTIVVEVDGSIAGHATGYRFDMAVGGRDVRVRGVAGVAVVPEYRRMGVAEAAMIGMLRQMRRRGEALSMLYAFRMSFYRKLGYGTVEWADDLRVTPDLLVASPLRRHVQALDRERHETELRRVYERWRTMGRSGPIRRLDTWWKHRVWERCSDGAVYVDPATRKIAGYALFDVPADPPYPRQHLHLRELVALTPDAYRGLIGYLEAQGDQFRLLALALPRGEAAGVLRDFTVVGLSQAVERLRLMETAGLVAGGAMLRLVDVPGALALHPAPSRNRTRGRIGLDLSDPVFPGQTRAYDVTFGARGAAATPGHEARDRVALSATHLAQVYGGGASAGTLHAQGAITGSARAAERLDEAFAGRPWFLGMMNGF